MLGTHLVAWSHVININAGVTSAKTSFFVKNLINNQVEEITIKRFHENTGKAKKIMNRITGNLTRLLKVYSLEFSVGNTNANPRHKLVKSVYFDRSLRFSRYFIAKLLSRLGATSNSLPPTATTSSQSYVSSLYFSVISSLKYGNTHSRASKMLSTTSLVVALKIAACLDFKAKQSCHVLPQLQHPLHSIPVEKQIEQKILTLTFKSFSVFAPLVEVAWHSYHYCPTSFKLKTFGDHLSAHRVWSLLPHYLRADALACINAWSSTSFSYYL